MIELLLIYLSGYLATFFILFVAMSLDARLHGFRLHQWLSENDIEKAFIWPIISWIGFIAGMMACVYYLYKIAMKKIRHESNN